MPGIFPTDVLYEILDDRYNFNNMGTWQVGTQYAAGDVVDFGGNTYRALIPNIGVTPANGGTWALRVVSANNLAGYASAAAASAAQTAAIVADQDARIAAVETGQSSAVVGYATQALLYADLVPADKSVAYVTNDSTASKNGTYRKSGASGAGSWVQSSYDRVALVEGRMTATEAYTDLLDAHVFDYVSSKNLYNSANDDLGHYLNSVDGSIVVGVGWGCSGAIPVVIGTAYTLSFSGTKRLGLCFYNASNAPIAGSYTGIDTTNLTVTAPATAAYVRFNILSTTAPKPADIQFEVGYSATSYEAYHVAYPKAKLVPLDYTVESVSKNLFNPLTVQTDKYITSVSPYAITGATGWGCSDYIPVVAGTSYTISGSRGRVGLMFFTAKSASSPASTGYNGSAVTPLTVVAPVDALYLVVNLYSPAGTSYSNIQVEEGAAATGYTSLYGANTMLRREFVYPGDSPIPRPFAVQVKRVGTKFYVRSRWDYTHDICTLWEISTIANKTVQPWSTSLILAVTPNDNLVPAHDAGVFHTTGDDATPMRLNDGTVGANHSHAQVLQVVAAAHGKTHVDVGSVWTDGASVRWVLLAVISVNNLYVVQEYTMGGSGDYTINSTMTGSTLTHAESATNTGSITVGSFGQAGLYPSVRSVTQQILLDGNFDLQTAVDGMYYGEFVSFVESYTITSLARIIDYAKSHVGPVTALDYADVAIGGLAELKHVYRVSEKNYTDVIARIEILEYARVKDCGIVQSAALTVNGGRQLIQYVPGTLPITLGGVPYDYSAGRNITGIVETASWPVGLWRYGVPPSIMGQIVTEADGTPVVGFALGYRDLGSCRQSVRTTAVDGAVELRDTKKQYPSAFGTGVGVAAGTIYEVHAFRKYFLPTTHDYWFA